MIVAQAAYTAAEFQLFMAGDPEAVDVAESPSLAACIESNAVWSPESYVDSLSLIRRINPERAFFSHDAVVWESTASP